jgi:Disulphide bond corrector protein DsbC
MRTLLAGTLLLLSTAVLAQDELAVKGPLVAALPAPLATVIQGKASTETLSFRVSNGYHINSNTPKSEFLIPTSLKVDAITDVVIGKITYPEGQDMSFAFSPDEKLNVYTGTFRIDVLVRALRSVQPGKYAVRGTLKYQACDNSACYPPKNLPVLFDVKIAKAPPAARPNPKQSPHAHR